MKKLTTLITALVLLFSTTFAFNSNNGNNPFENISSKKTSEVSASNVTKEVTNAFASKFAGAEKVSWKQQSEFYFAEFRLADKTMAAAYNSGGELIGISRNLEMSQLPMNVEASIRETFKDYRISDLITEIVFEGETAYYFHAENSSRSLKLKCLSNGQTQVLKRTKKKLVGSVY